MLVCYLCGTQHGLTSLAIHQKQCAAKREKAQAALLPQDRTPAPSAPAMAVPSGPRVTSAEVEAYNEAAQAAYNGSMPQCVKCGRTFATAEKLATHAKSCKATPQETEDPPPSPPSPPLAAAAAATSPAVEAVVRDELGGSVPPRGGPRMLVCYLCGTKHGLSSLLFHQKQCSATREKIQATLLPHERTRAPDPPVVDLPLAKSFPM